MTIKEVIERLEESESLKAIAQAYSEIANLKIKAIRTGVERNRLFLQEVSKVYGLVRRLAIQKGTNLTKSKKTVTILITSNYHFYGSINEDLIEFFIAHTKTLSTDRIIIGKTALDFFKINHVFSNYTPIMLKKDLPTSEELSSIINLIKDYSQILIVHSRLKSLLMQESVVTDITPVIKPSGEQQNFKFIFEPDLPKIMTFFDNQILNLLLEETFLESELSRTASRFISMDTAENQANKTIKEYEKLVAYLKRNQDNDKILENFASMAVARKETI